MQSFAQFDPLPQPIPFDEFRAEVESLYGPRFRRKSTRSGIVYVLNILERLNLQTTAEFNVSLIARFLEALPKNLAKHSIQGYLRRLQAIVSHASRSGYCARNPFAIRPVKSWIRPGRPKGKRHLSRDEIARIRATMVRDVETRTGWRQWRARRDLAIFDVISLAGLRKSEALWLRVSDLDLDRRIIDVVDHEGHALKTESSNALVPMPEALVLSLNDWIPHRMDAPPGFKRPRNDYLFPNLRVSTPWVNGPPGYRPLDRLQSAAKRAGVTEGVSFQSLRRSLATHLPMHGASGAMVARILRHSEDVDRQFYMQDDAANLVACVSGFHY